MVSFVGGLRSSLAGRRAVLRAGALLLVCCAAAAESVVLPELWRGEYPGPHLLQMLSVLGLTMVGCGLVAWVWLDLRREAATIERLRASEERFRLLTAQTAADVWTTDMDLRLTSVYGLLSPRLERTDLRKPGTTLHELFDTRDESHPVIAAHRRALAGLSTGYERTAGSLIIDGRVEPLRDETGAVVGCVGVALDVTRRRTSEQHLRLLANAVESASDMIAVTDVENRFVYVNEAFLRTNGFVREEVLGQTPALLRPPDEVRQEILAATIQGGWTGDLVTRRKDGTDLPVSLSTTVVRDPEGRILGLLGVARDISEPRRAEEALRRSRERFELAARAADEVIWEQDFSTGMTWWSPRLERVLGYAPTAARMDEEWWRENIHPDDCDRVMLGWRRAVEGGEQHWADEFRLRGSHAEYVVVSTLGYIVRDAAGKALRMVGALTDLTFRKQAEAVAGRYLALIESSEDAIISTDLDGVVETWNLAAERLYGYPADEILGRQIAVLEPAERAGEGAALRERLTRGERPPPYETTRRRRDGSLVEISTLLSPIFDREGQLVGVSAVVRDITERVRAAAALERLASFPQLNPTPIVEVDASGNVTYMNPAAERSLPDLRRGVRGHPFLSGAWALARQPAGERLGLCAREVQVGATWYLQNLSVLPDRSHLRIYATDVTERRRAEDAVRESERQFRTVLDRMRLIGLGLDTSGRITYCNDYLAEVSGWPREELIGSDYFARFLQPRDPAIGVFERAMAAGEVPAHHRNEILTRDGLVRKIEWNNTLLRDSDGRLTGIVSIGEDVTERARAELELLRSQEELRALAGHLESAREEERARMARGIHDELGQMLTALRLDLSWLATRLREPTPAVKRKIGEMIVMTDDTIEAGRRIVADLRPPILDDLGLVPAVQWYVEHLGKRAGLHIRLLADGGEPKLDPRLAVAGYRIVQEALTNVARHARARNVEVRVGAGGGSLVLEVRDDGCGIPASAASDPRSFGIAGMRERARSSGGTLEISGNAGAGTLVRVAIPIERRGAAREPA
jgi:PAS domain S-box-containing protein